MDIEWLRSYLSLHETGNFTKSATVLNVSQAAFSRRIQSLENWVGKTLVDRSKKPVRFTPEGLVFYQEAAEIVAQLSRARMVLSAPELGNHHQVKIAMPHVISTSRFVPWWKQWSHGSSLTASASVGNVSDTITKFITGGADILICHTGHTMPMMMDPETYSVHVLEQDRLSPMAKRGSISNGSERFPGAVHQPVPLLMYSSGAYFSQLVEYILQHTNRRLHGFRHIEADISSVLLDAVTAGLGVAWLPQCIISQDVKEDVVELGGGEWSMDMSIHAYIRKSTTNPASRLLWERMTGAEL